MARRRGCRRRYADDPKRKAPSGSTSWDGDPVNGPLRQRRRRDGKPADDPPRQRAGTTAAHEA
ncbi:MAG: hypothetical protein MZV49_14435 [Rhodopseudomonas palustris]|nr:hypothetical protein [Rhodopseudomonas palustris]